MDRYYIEFVIPKTLNTFDMQSHWFDSEEKAMEWLREFDYISMQVEIYLMKAHWYNEEEYGDISQVRRVI